MPTILTTDMILPYLRGDKKHKNYPDTVKEYAELKVHIDGEYPKEVIETVRPSEPAHIKEYRKSIFAAITMPVVSKVFNSASKIRKSSDWVIRFDKSKVPSSIAESETPDQYYNHSFPFFGSLTSWTFSMFLKQYGCDANMLMVVMPIDWKINSNEYYRPFPYLFNSPQVVEYVQDDYAIVKSTDKSSFMFGDIPMEGEVYYVITTTDIQRWEQRDNVKGFAQTGTFIHNFGKLPAWRVGGVGHKAMDNTFYFRSRFYPMLPYLKEAVREYTDLQAGVIQHLYLERWEYEGPTCKTCQGSGKVKKGEKTVKCPAGCNKGAVMSSPYETMIVRRPRAGEAPAPSPSAGFIDRNPEIIKVQDARVDAHCFKALAAVNMEFLAMVPLAVSGASKNADRDEANNWVHSIGEDVVMNLDKYVYFGNEYRYMKVVSDAKKRNELLPKIPVPEKFDLFNSQILVDEIAQVSGKVNSTIKMALEIEYINKKFGYDPQTKNNLTLAITLDPLPGTSADEKAAMKMNGGVTEINYTISCNITPFVRRALEENANFATMKQAQQLEILGKYAKESLAETEASTLKKQNLEPDPEDDIN